MARTALITRLLAMALVAVALVGAVTPVCAMPDCGDVVTGTCTDFPPACDDCPEPVMMKHTPDDAMTAQPTALGTPTFLAYVTPIAAPVPASWHVGVPDVTSSPPPLDPLGVRLTI